jgi:hypothetical protein
MVLGPDPDELPGTDHPRGAFVRLDLNEDGSNVRDGADVRAVANHVANLELHVLLHRSLCVLVASAARSIPDLGDEPPPVVIYDVPTKGATQLRSAQRVDGAACIVLRGDVRQPPAVTGDEGPHAVSLEASRTII